METTKKAATMEELDNEEVSKLEDLEELALKADILVSICMASAQGVIALLREAEGNFSHISEITVLGLEQSLWQLDEAVNKIVIYVS